MPSFPKGSETGNKKHKTRKTQRATPTDRHGTPRTPHTLRGHRQQLGRLLVQSGSLTGIDHAAGDAGQRIDQGEDREATLLLSDRDRFLGQSAGNADLA